MHGGSRAVGRRVKPPRFARRKASRQPACYAVRPRRVRAVALCLWCGPSDGRGGGASAATIRQTWPGAPPRPSAYPRRGLMPPRPPVLCAPKDFGTETAFDLISRLHHFIHESLRLCLIPTSCINGCTNLGGFLPRTHVFIPWPVSRNAHFGGALEANAGLRCRNPARDTARDT